MRDATEALCDSFTRAEAACFRAWCDLLDGRADPRPAVLVESQASLHEAAALLREWCLADPAAASAERRELLSRQAEGEAAVKIALRLAARERRPAADRDGIRRGWVEARYRILCQRLALSCGLGWPHRGEQVIVSTWIQQDDGSTAPVTGQGIYLDSCDIYHARHSVWLPDRGKRRRHGTVTVEWLPNGAGGQLGPASADGDIGLRVLDAPARRLPVPLVQWPDPVDASASTPADGEPDPQPTLFSASDVPQPSDGWRPSGRRPRQRQQAQGPGGQQETLF